MRKILSLFLAILMAASLTVAAAQEAAPNVLTYSMGTKPNVDPHWNAGSTGAMLLGLMYEGLYNYTQTGYALAGATSVDISEDGLTWVFHLREDAVWSDGKPVTAENYVYSMKRLVNPEIATTYMLDYGQFLKNGTAISKGEKPLEELGVTAVDDFTLQIELENVCTFFDTILCYSAFYPLREEFVLEDGTGNWAWDVARSITNGKMNMTFCDEEQQIILEKSTTYWNKDAVALDKLDVKLIDDTNSALSMLLTGSVDMITAYPSEETQRLREEGYYHSTSALATNFLLVNTQKEPLNNPNVRKALALSIDRAYLSEVLLVGTKTPAVSYIGKGFPGSTSDKDFRTEGGDLFAYDPEAARAALAEAGFPGGEGFPVLECSYSNASADYTIIFEYLQAVWEEELGLTVVLSPTENAAMTELRDAGKFDITPQGWGADYLDASNMLSIFVTGNFINAGRYSNAKFDELYTKSLSTMDMAERVALLQEAEKILVVEDWGIIPLYHSNSVALYQDSVVSNVTFNSTGKVILENCVVTK